MYLGYGGKCFGIAIKPLTTIPMTAATTSPKIPAAIAPREALAGNWVGLLFDARGRPWLTAEASSRTLSAGRAKAKRFAMLLITSDQSNHCQPQIGPVRAGAEKERKNKQIR